MPVRNEARVLAGVLTEWLAAADALAVPYRLVVYDDGSEDDSAAVARRFAAQRPAIVHVVRQANRGHGPTLYRGYCEAHGRWLLQVDGDGEIGAEVLACLWRQRRGQDVVVVARGNRPRCPDRRVASAGARWLLRLLFGLRLADPNSPCRLLRREAVRPLLARLAPDTAVPNLALLAWARRCRLRIAEVPAVSVRQHASGLRGRHLWRLAGRGVWEILAVRVARDSPQAGW